MSNVSNTHDVVSFVSGKSVAFTGQRLAKVTYKTDKETGKKKDAKCVSIPCISDAQILENVNVLIPAIREWMSSAQDGIIRGLVDSGASMIQDSAISPEAIAAYVDSESTGGRLTKESIGAWFDGSIADSLRVAFADRLGISDNPTADEMFRVEQTVAVYKDKFSAMAGGKTNYVPEIAEKLAKALEFASDEDEIARKFAARLAKMSQPATVDMLGL